MSVQMELHKIIISEMQDQQIIVLKEVDGERKFPIVIGSTRRPLPQPPMIASRTSASSPLPRVTVASARRATRGMKMISYLRRDSYTNPGAMGRLFHTLGVVKVTFRPPRRESSALPG